MLLASLSSRRRPGPRAAGCQPSPPSSSRIACPGAGRGSGIPLSFTCDERWIQLIKPDGGSNSCRSPTFLAEARYPEDLSVLYNRHRTEGVEEGVAEGVAVAVVAAAEMAFFPTSTGSSK